MTARDFPSVSSIPVDRVKGRDSNPRTHSDEQIAQIANSIEEFGFVNPILIDTKSVIVAGHGRLAAAKRLGLSHVPCIVLDGLTEAQCQALVIADNKIALNAGWDPELLAVEIKDIIRVSEVDIETLGFSGYELEAILAGMGADTPTQVAEEDKTQDPRASVRVVVDRDDEQRAREVIIMAMDAAGMTYDLK